jgi:hypothetical protein
VKFALHKRFAPTHDLIRTHKKLTNNLPPKYDKNKSLKLKEEIIPFIRLAIVG